MFPSEPIVRAAEIDGKFRYSLKRAWSAGPHIVWIGSNPSDANGLRDDPTIWREIGFSFRWGYGSMTKVNLSPYISSLPTEERAWRRQIFQPDSVDHEALAAFAHNIDIAVAEIRSAQDCIAAWGNLADEDAVVDFLCAVDEELERKLGLLCIGKTLSGAPIHPLARGKHRVPDMRGPSPWSRP